MKSYYVYIMSNQSNSVLYIGVTNDLIRRVYEHKNKLIEGFTKRYNLNKLVYFECVENVNVAIAREKQLKGWRRSKKDALIQQINSQLEDLSEQIQ